MSVPESPFLRKNLCCLPFFFSQSPFKPLLALVEYWDVCHQVMSPSATWKMKRQTLLKSSWGLNLGVAYFLVWTAVYVDATLPETLSWVFLMIRRGNVSLQLSSFAILFSSFPEPVLLVPVFSGIVCLDFVPSTSLLFWCMKEYRICLICCITLEANFPKYLLG